MEKVFRESNNSIAEVKNVFSGRKPVLVIEKLIFCKNRSETSGKQTYKDFTESKYTYSVGSTGCNKKERCHLEITKQMQN